MTVRTGFVVLPDVPAAQISGVSVPFEAPQVLAHPSGRPWLIGHWSPDEMLVANVGPVHVVVIGFCPVTTARLVEMTGRTGDLSDIDTLARALPGSFHLVAASRGRVRVQGSVTGLRRVFHAKLGGLPVASDSAVTLAAMKDARVDEQALAVRVACGGLLPPPLGEQSMWEGVTTLPPDHALIMEPDGIREIRWWRPPVPEQSLEQGSEAVRDALMTATVPRRPVSGRLSADLSGGMDSTSLCFLASRDTPDLITFRWGEADPGNDDAFFATHAAQSLPQAQHLIAPQSRLPDVFADPDTPADTEQPYLFTRTAARMRYTAGLLAEHGSRLHLAGHGGDELFFKFPGYVHGLLRRRPRTGLRHVRAHYALSRWPLGATVAQLADRGDVSSWWRAQADSLLAPPPSPRYPSLSWGFTPLRAAEWVTEDTSAAAREELRRTAESVRPLAPDRGQHQFLLALRTTGAAYRQLAHLFSEAHVSLHMPYLDDRVVEAALAVRLHERAMPWRYKPLLADAMRGIVPDAVLDRSTKGEFSRDLYTGWRRNLPAILETFSDSALAAHGLIDTDVLRTKLLAPQADGTMYIAIEHLLGCETWFRSTRRRINLRRIDGLAPTS
ncbi:lasso peptide isopeptide bond-forming cyclase [Streptomyces sp. NPDC079020]|uniref:lasso peptide isopeptide bond-forming cyclase n=1 Tax=Streptomyces sp. NPDC079020 TaxID=3365722 RepID=UPI0037D7234D